MTEMPVEPPLEDKGISWTKMRQWVANVISLERKVGDLDRRNRELQSRLETLQHQMNKQAGQMEVLLGFITSALDDKIAARAEEAAFKALERLETLESLRESRKK